MVQQLNLYDERLRPRAAPLNVAQAGAAALAVLLATVGAAHVLSGRAASAAHRATALEQGIVALATISAASAPEAAARAGIPAPGVAASVAAPSSPAPFTHPGADAAAATGAGSDANAAAPSSRSADASSEIERLRRFDAAQRRAQAALDADTVRSRRAYADYFDALARQARASLWITGLSVSPDGDAIELEGRMLDAGALPDYLRRLNGEPRFRGRPFARLNLSALDAPADAASRPFLEFALRSTAGTIP